VRIEAESQRRSQKKKIEPLSFFFVCVKKKKINENHINFHAYEPVKKCHASGHSFGF